MLLGNQLEAVGWQAAQEATVSKMESVESNIKELHMDSTGINLKLEGGACQLLAESFIDQFKDSGAENYLVVTFESDLGPLSVTMQRENGLTPIQKVAALQAEIAELKEEDQLAMFLSERQQEVIEQLQAEIEALKADKAKLWIDMCRNMEEKR
jgi:FtsZ-binding cell division protein ZapB